MTDAIAAVLAYAVGVGISPVPIIAVILMLFSSRANVNGPLFLGGWVVGLTALITVVYVLAHVLHVGTSSTANNGVSWLRIALGVGLLLAAGRKWRKRPREGDEPTTPRWMSGVDDFSPARALGLALALSANPKNIMLALGAGTSVAQLDVTSFQASVAIGVFVLIGSSIVIVSVAYRLFGGDRARRNLDDFNAWLMVHNSAVMTVVLLVFSAVLVSQGLGLRR